MTLVSEPSAVGTMGSSLRRYQTMQTLHVASDVETVLAEDSAQPGTLAVVKRVRVRTIASSTLARVHHETMILRRLPGVSGPFLLDAGVEDGWLWFAQRFIPGETLHSRLLRGPLSVDEALEVAGDILAQLAQAHDAGVVHRDVKPANIMVGADGLGSDDGRSLVARRARPATLATLVDWGLARSPWLDPTVRDQAVGTARYVSPEQAGLVDRPVDSRCDLYSFGVVLFECLAGRAPFDGADVSDVLRQHLVMPTPDLRSIGVRVPRAVAEVVDRLLRKDPAERYQSAAAALIDVDAIASARRNGVADPAVVVGRSDARSTLTEPTFVGRAKELNDLVGMLSRAESGTAALAVVAGESGAGKSRLLDELAKVAAERGMWVLRGQGVDQTAQRPFQPFDGVAGDVAGTLSAQPAQVVRLQARLGGAAEPLSAALPQLGSVIASGGAPKLPDQYGERRTIAALSDLLVALGTEERPALVILDDCQWASEVTAKVLRRWRRHQERSEGATVVVVAYRSDEVPADSPLGELAADMHLGLGPLDAGEVTDLIVSMAGQVPSDAVSTVSRLSEGNPFLAQAVLRGMVECGALVRTAGGWDIDVHSHGEVQASRRAALFLIRRLDLLSPPARRVLELGAVLGKEFDIELAVTLSGLPGEDARVGLDDAHRRRILWVDDEAGRARFVHDKLREAVLDALGPGTRQTLHQEAAEEIQARAGVDPAAQAFDLAYHYDAAGHPDAAVPYALAAAERARAQHALDVAEANYAIAARGTTAGDPRQQATVAEGLGDVLVLRGRYGEAETQLRRALELTEERVHRAALEGKLGDLAFRRGEQGQACRLLEGALRQLGHRVPRHTLGFLPGLLMAMVVQAWHTLAPSRLGRQERVATESESLTMRLHSRLAYAYWFRSGILACAWTHLRGMNLAERFGPSAELAQAYSEHAPVMTMLPWYSRGIAYASKSLAIRTELADVWGRGQSLHFQGVVLYAASRYREALACCHEAVRLLARTGDQWEMNTATWHIAFAHYRLGELDQAASVSAQLYADASDIGDQMSAGIALSGWSRATDGVLPAEIVARELARRNEDVQTATEVALAESLRLLATNQPGQAVAVLEHARSQVRRARLRQEYVAPVAPWLASALRVQMESLPAAAPQARALLARRGRATRAACRIARDYRNNLPHALRERALYAAARGRTGRARRLLDQATAVAVAQEASFEAAQSRAARGRLGLLLGWPGAARDQAASEEALSRLAGAVRGVADGAGTARARSAAPFGEAKPTTALSAADTLSLARTDQFLEVLSAGRAIAAAITTSAVRRAIEEHVPSVLRAQKCVTFEVRGSVPVLGPLDDRPPGEALSGQLSRTLIAQTIETGQVAIAAPGGAGQPSDSLVLSGMRSALCAPISRSGKVVAGFYLTHRDVAGVFGEEERRLASFLGAVAGATLEHVAGSEAHFRALVRNSHDLTIVADADGRSLYVSPSVTRILGYAPSDLTRLDGRLVHPDDFEAMIDAFRLCKFSPATHPSAELRARHQDGSWRWLEVTLSNLLADASIRGVVFNIRDITDRKSAELALGQATEQFRLSFENAPIGMALTSIEPGTGGWLLRVNQALADMLGYSRQELEGRTIWQLTHPDDRAADEVAMHRFQSGEATSFSTEKRYRHADGHYIWAHLQANVVKGGSGPADYVISQMLDITERRAAEERLTFLALHDPLTGLANRRLLLDRLAVALARSARSHHSVAVLYLDLDGFKVVNDTYGHDQGDHLLIQVASRLGALVRDADTLARLGGDEFVLVAEDLAHSDDAAMIAERILETFSHPFTLHDGVEVTVGASIGVALGTGGSQSSALDAKTLLRHADSAMYDAKQRGAGTACRYREP